MLAFHVYSRRFANSIGLRPVQQRDRSRCTLVQASPNYRRIQASVGHRHISEIVRQPGLALTIAFLVHSCAGGCGDSDASARIGSKIIETLYDSTMVKNESEIQTGTHPRYRINCLFGVCCFCSSTVST